MPRQLDGLQRGRSRDAASLVVEHEPLLAGHSVAAQSEAHLAGEGLDEIDSGELPGRAHHERDRTRQVAARVRVRPPDVCEQHVVVAGVLCDPVRGDDGRERAHTASDATTSISAAIAGRSASRSRQAAIAG